MLVDFLRVVAAARWVEQVRLEKGPRLAMEVVRSVGATKADRGPAGRFQLARIVRVVDRLFSGGPICYRRALLEAALDSGAAAEPLMMGFRTADGSCEGHAWLGSDASASSYDVVVSA
jgi:hypothetical protein